MKCPKCHSENVQVQAKRVKFPMGALLLTFGGFGLMFFGIIGALCGIVLGLIIGAIIKGLTPTAYESIVICQECGFVGKPNHEIPDKVKKS